MSDLLLETLRDAQRFGFFGGRSMDEAVEHSMGFVAALPDAAAIRIVDMGSGGGLPGLVMAAERPAASFVLIDRRQKRTDHLRRAVARLGWEHVDVIFGDVEDLALDVEAGASARFDVVTARGFGPPVTTLRLARRLVAEGGCIIISDPPHDDRWDEALIAEMSLRRERLGPVSRFRVVGGA